jgi:phosphomethylpyrimidine synthase
MKITQEVRDFAAKQNASADTFLATTEAPSRDGEGDLSQHGGRGPVLGPEAGMAEMSHRFRESGANLYVPDANPK